MKTGVLKLLFAESVFAIYHPPYTSEMRPLFCTEQKPVLQVMYLQWKLCLLLKTRTKSLHGHRVDSHSLSTFLGTLQVFAYTADHSCFIKDLLSIIEVFAL